MKTALYFWSHLDKFLLGCITVQSSCCRCSMVCVCLLVTTMSCAKTAEPVEMTCCLGCGLWWAQGSMNEVGPKIHPGEKRVWGISWPILSIRNIRHVVSIVNIIQ